MDTPTITDDIIISYETNDVSVFINLSFGKGKDSDRYPDEKDRTDYTTPYYIENYDVDGKKMYCLLAEEGPFIMHIKKVRVVPKNNRYKRYISNGYATLDYGISAVLDINKEPIYNNPTGFNPSNIDERDGNPWIVKNKHILKVDQNGRAKFQWTTAKALEKGVEPTPEQELAGVEKRHDKSGMIYITFQPLYTEEITYDNENPEEDVMRGGGGLTRGLTRGINITKSVAARVGYGSSASTKSLSVDAKQIENSRFILPIRIRIIGNTTDNVKCAKNLFCATRLDELQRNTGVLPDMD